MPTRGTPVRTVRVDDELWEAAVAKAAAQSTDDKPLSVGDVIRAALRRYVGR